MITTAPELYELFTGDPAAAYVALDIAAYPNALAYLHDAAELLCAGVNIIGVGLPLPAHVLAVLEPVPRLRIAPATGYQWCRISDSARLPEALRAALE